MNDLGLKDFFISSRKEKYKLRRIDKIEKLSENLDLIKTFIDVLK